jgi:predicted DNA-binding transcriptional regulator YafY
MDRSERFRKILDLLRNRRLVSARLVRDTLEISPATFKRDLEYLRSRFDIPIEWDRERNGYSISADAVARGKAELPGMWFSAEEAYALLTMHQLLSKLEPGLLQDEIAPLKERLEKLIALKPGKSGEVMKRIRILSMGQRTVPATAFSALARALLERRQVHVSHYSRERNDVTERDLSPQRLTHYRDNWYLDAWCHLRKDLRVFSVDTLSKVQPLEARAREVPAADLDRELASSYGIFSGTPTEVAKLRFSEARSRWVSRERWHPQQKAGWEGARYVLEIPYRDDRELLMDVLRHGADVEVVAPAALRRRHKEALQQAAAQYA